MSEMSAPASAIGRWTLRKLAHPATLMLLASNAIPLIGLVFWRWDAFVLLLGYWMETAVVAFWTLVRIAVRPEEATGDSKSPRPGPIRRAFILAFVILFVGIFMIAHFGIIWEAFGGTWRGFAASGDDFVRTILWGTGLWIAVVAAFISRGATCLRDLIDPVRIRRWILAIWPEYPGALPGDRRADPGAALIGLGGRIILMQVAVLLGGFIAVKLGMLAPVILPLLILIAIKTYIELSLHIAAWPDAET
jgi:hypothetical protein